MPSLRRIVSSPASPRSSPYTNNTSSSSSSSSSSRQHSTRTRSGQPHRRASGSETSSRRILGDLDWWTVVDGQCDPIRVVDENTGTIPGDENSPPSVQSAPTPVSFADESLSFTPMMEWPNVSEPPHFPVAQFGSLGFNFDTPSRSGVRSPSPSLTSSSSTPSSSGPSTPTSSSFALPGWESDNMLSLSPLPTTKRMPSRLAKPAPARAHTFSDFKSLMQEDYLNTYSNTSNSNNGLAAPFGGYADFSTSSPLSAGFPALFG